jgi:flagellin-like protein
MEYKKGISGVVTVLIIVLLALVAAGVVWVVIQGTVEDAGEEISGRSACIGINLNIKSVDDCLAGSTNCSLVIERKSGGGIVKDIRVVITDDTTTMTEDLGRAMEVLETVTIEAGSAVPLTNNAKTAKVTALVDNGEGGYIVCDAVDTYTYVY